MILEDVPNGADALVETAAAAHAKCFRHGDLRALDVLGIPDRLQKRVGEPEIQKVLDRLFAEEMIDAVDGRLRKRLVDGRVESLGRREVTTEWFFHDHTGLRGTTRPCQARCDGTEQTRRNRQIEQRPFGRAERLPQFIERGRVLVVTGHVGESRR